MLIDNANNASTFELIYKIDKTAPQFLLGRFEETDSSDIYTYVNPVISEQSLA
jgi:hypothetical protein